MALHSKNHSSSEILANISNIQEHFSLEKIEHSIDRALCEFQTHVSQKCEEIKTRLLDSLRNNIELKKFKDQLENQKALALTIVENFDESKELTEEQEERKDRLMKMLRTAVQELIYEGDGIQCLLNQSAFSKTSSLFNQIEENICVKVTLKRCAFEMGMKGREEVKQNSLFSSAPKNPFDPTQLFRDQSNGSNDWKRVKDRSQNLVKNREADLESKEKSDEPENNSIFGFSKQKKSLFKK